MLPSGFHGIGNHYICSTLHEFFEDTLIVRIYNYRSVSQMTAIKTFVGSPWGSYYPDASFVDIGK
jgi:hypothetical protein